LKFLEKCEVFDEGDCHVDGAKVWDLYRRIMENPEDDFISKKIERKAIQGILSKFTFSMFNSDKTFKALMEYSNPIYNPQKSKEYDLSQAFSYGNYLYLSDHARIYHIKSGLMEHKFNDPENQVL
jgi:hypothetical protein